MNCESRDVGFSHRTRRRKTDRTFGKLMWQSLLPMNGTTVPLKGTTLPMNGTNFAVEGGNLLPMNGTIAAIERDATTSEWDKLCL